jgi:integrase
MRIRSSRVFLLLWLATLAAYYRRLPSGKWQATVRDRGGKKHTHSDKFKSVVRAWAVEQEARFERGDRRDPRAGDVKVGEWHRRRSAARGVDDATRAKLVSLWRTHCESQWSDWPMSAPSRMEAQEWVNRMRVTRKARHAGRAVAPGAQDVPLIKPETIRAAVHLMSSLYEAAITEGIVYANPFSRLELPPIEPLPVQFYEHDEAEALFDAIERLSGRKWRTLTELGMQLGLRPGEAYGLHAHRVDWLRGKLAVVDVMTRTGLRQYPKSRKSHRVVPVPAHVLDGMSALMAGRPRESLVFTAPEGGPVSDGLSRNRAWDPAAAAARVCGKLGPAGSDEYRAGECGPKFCDDPQHKIRRFPPKIMRHTAASWLVQDGVPLYDVQALLGHESFATTQRYAHLAPDAHSRVLESWAKARWRTCGARSEGGPLLMTTNIMRNSPLTCRFAMWAWEDLNLRPLPYQGSALTV